LQLDELTLLLLPSISNLCTHGRNSHTRTQARDEHTFICQKVDHPCALLRGPWTSVQPSTCACSHARLPLFDLICCNISVHETCTRTVVRMRLRAFVGKLPFCLSIFNTDWTPSGWFAN
jgi:hypothetical protein